MINVGTSVEIAQQFNSPPSCPSWKKEQATELSSPSGTKNVGRWLKEAGWSPDVWQHPSSSKDHTAECFKFLTEATV